MRAAISEPIPHESASSYATMTLFVFFTDVAIVSMSRGESVRRSMTSVSIPCFSSAIFAASCVRLTSAPHVTTVSVSPSRTTFAFPRGIMYSFPGFFPLL
jgi:hypothetical protein